MQIKKNEVKGLLVELLAVVAYIGVFFMMTLALMM